MIFCSSSDINKYLKACLCINEQITIPQLASYPQPSRDEIYKCVYASNVYREMESLNNLVEVKSDKDRYCENTKRFSSNNYEGESDDISNSGFVFNNVFVMKVTHL